MHAPLFPYRRLRAAPALALAALLTACGESDSPSGNTPDCPDQDVLAAPSPQKPAHAAKRVAGKPLDSLPGIAFAPPDSVAAWFGGKAVKLAFILNRSLYLAEWGSGGVTLTGLTAGDEGYAGGPGNPNSPLFDPTGRWIAFGGSLAKPAVAFVREAVSGSAPAWRVPLDASGFDQFDPHWAEGDSGRPWLHFATDPGPVAWSGRCGQMGGATYRARFLPDPSSAGMGPVEPTGWPGSFKGGLSKDGRWAGTSYGPSALYDVEANRTILLADLAQQCNPSMNPYPAGSANTDHMMILGFGGTMKTVAGDVEESIHENLWIYGRDDRIVWRGRLPPDSKYRQWQKPEWSTHPAYATAVALYEYQGGTATRGDLYAVRLGDLANREGAALAEAEGHHKLAEGRFGEGSFSHLWVEP